MKYIIRVLIGAAIVLPFAFGAPAVAQPCSGNFAAGSVCGNSGAGSKGASSMTPTQWFDRWCSSSNNTVPVRLSGSWICLASANSSVWATNGSGVPSLTQTLPSAVQGNITTLGIIGTPTTFTASPLTLAAASGGAAFTFTSVDTNTASINIGTSPTNTWAILKGIAADGRPLLFYEDHTGVSGSAAARMTILPGGNVGVGTTAPAKQFHTTGSMRFGNFTCNGSLVVDASGDVSCSPAIYVDNYGGCTGSASHDDVSIAAALAATPGNGTLIFPANTTCVVKGSGSTIFSRSLSITIYLRGSLITLDATTGTSRDVLTFAPAASATIRPVIIDCGGGGFDMNGTGRHGINIDTSPNNATNVADFQYKNCRDTYSGSTSGYSVNHVSSFTTPGSTGNGGLYNATFRNNVLTNGLRLQSGDTLRIEDNILTSTKGGGSSVAGGSGYGINVSQISGAGNLLVTGNNITAACAILVDSGVQPILKNNVVEDQDNLTNTCPNNNLVELRGSGPSSTSIVGGIVKDNQIQAVYTTTGSPKDLRLGAITDAKIDGNRMSNQSVAGITISASATGARLGINTFSSTSPNVSDSGTDTQYVVLSTTDAASAWTAYTPTITAGGGTFTTVSAAGRYKTFGKSVLLNVVVTITTNGTAGTYMSVPLPGGMAAAAATACAGTDSNGTAMSVGTSGGGGVLTAYKYDATYPGVSGHVYYINCSFEIS